MLMAEVLWVSPKMGMGAVFTVCACCSARSPKMVKHVTCVRFGGSIMSSAVRASSGDIEACKQ